MDNLVTEMLLFICPLLWLNYALAGVYIPNTPPVLLWGTDLGQSQSIFQPLRSSEFGRLLKTLWNDYMFLIYLSPELTSKDFNCKDCYNFTRRILPLTYYSQVQEPLKAIEKLGKIQWPDKQNTSTLTKELRNKITCQLNEIYAFNFTDRQLEQHDTFIRNISEHLANCPHKLLHIYTSYNELATVLKRRRWRRQDFKLIPPGDQIHEIIVNDAEGRQGKAATENLTVMRHSLGVFAIGKIVLAVEMKSGTIIYYNRSIIEIDKVGDPLALALIDVESVHKGVTLFLKNNLGYLTITLLPFDGNWLISRLSLNGNTTFFLRNMPFFSKKFSYCCSSLTAYTDNGTQLTLNSFYLDIITTIDQSGIDSDYKTKPCWSCEKYLTTSIVQAIFVMLILITILSIGLAMIWDIGRNKRMQNANEPDIHIRSGG